MNYAVIKSLSLEPHMNNHPLIDPKIKLEGCLDTLLFFIILFIQIWSLRPAEVKNGHYWKNEL